MRIVIYSVNKNDGLVRHTWKVAATFAKSIGFDKAYPVASMEELILAFEDIAKNPAKEIQFWGHGGPGRAFVGYEFIGTDKGGNVYCQSYDPITLEFTYLESLSGRLKNVLPNILDKGLLWLRTCGSFSGEAGQRFGIVLADITNSTVAAHTYAIGLVHSGLHVVEPNGVPIWRTDEGNSVGVNKNGDEILLLKDSALSIPNSFMFYKMTLPKYGNYGNKR